MNNDKDILQKRNEAFAVLYALIKQKFPTIVGKSDSNSFSAYRKNKIVRNEATEIVWVRKEESKEGVLRIACVLYDRAYLDFVKSLGFSMHRSFGEHYAGSITDFDKFLEKHQDLQKDSQEEASR